MGLSGIWTDFGKSRHECGKCMLCLFNKRPCGAVAADPIFDDGNDVLGAFAKLDRQLSMRNDAPLFAAPMKDKALTQSNCKAVHELAAKEGSEMLIGFLRLKDMFKKLIELCEIGRASCRERVWQSV